MLVHPYLIEFRWIKLQIVLGCGGNGCGRKSLRKQAHDFVELQVLKQLISGEFVYAFTSSLDGRMFGFSI